VTSDTLEADVTTDSVSVEVPKPGTYRVVPEKSTVSYTSRHMFGLGVVHAAFDIAAGELVVGQPPTDSTVSVSVKAASFRSNSARRDKDVRSAGLLDVATYPEITFQADHLRHDDDRWVASGSVTAHGASVPVDVLISYAGREETGIRVRGRAEHLDRYAFGITKSKGMVGRFLDLDLDVLAVPTS
jgi:polyisoprenoid-binding protein YceI